MPQGSCCETFFRLVLLGNLLCRFDSKLGELQLRVVTAQKPSSVGSLANWNWSVVTPVKRRKLYGEHSQCRLHHNGIHYLIALQIFEWFWTNYNLQS